MVPAVDSTGLPVHRCDGLSTRSLVETVMWRIKTCAGTKLTSFSHAKTAICCGDDVREEKTLSDLGVLHGSKVFVPRGRKDRTQAPK
ncbi:MAG: hypothetical protein JNL76_00830 [Alphaproteobacteria bacterium]|nr:hypothetical protein [Alphaproteobacteria bacterium]